MSAVITDADREAAHALMGADVINEAAKGLVENPEWDYDGADEAAKDYYRRFAAKCLARVEPLLAQALAGARAAERSACWVIAKDEIMHHHGQATPPSRCTGCTATKIADAIARRAGGLAEPELLARIDTFAARRSR